MDERIQMHAFTRPSQQLRLKVRHALLRSLHYTALYRRLLVANKLKGARLQTLGRAIHKNLNSTPNEGTTLLKFIYGQLSNGNIAMRYGHVPTEECPLCQKPDSCTHRRGMQQTRRSCGSDGTMRRANLSTPPSAKHQKGEEPSTRRLT